MEPAANRRRRATKAERYFAAAKRPTSETWRDWHGLKCGHHDLLSQEVLAAVGELAAAVAHEAKNPLAGISGAMQILKDALPGADPRSEVIDEVLKQVGRLDCLIRDLLVFARPWIPQKGAHDLAETVRHVADTFASQAHARHVSLELRASTPSPAHFDRPLIEMALANVLSNALDAAPPDGHVWVECAPTPTGARAQVDDDGPGIPPQWIDLIFKPFFTTKAKGTGLGLAIVKRVVDAHDGVLHVAARPDGGTRVTIELSNEGAPHGQG